MKAFSLIYLGLFLFFFSFIVLEAQDISEKTKSSIVVLKEKYPFIAKDDIAFKDYDYNDSNWDRLSIIDSWISVDKYSHHNGNAWFRIPFYLSITSNISVFIPAHNSGTQYYMNDSLIYESRKLLNNRFPDLPGKPIKIDIDNSNIYRSKKNILALRTSAFDNNSGFLFPIVIGDSTLVTSLYNFFIIKNSFLSAFCIFGALFFITIFYMRRSDHFYAAFSLLALGLGMWILGWKGIILYIIDTKLAYYIFSFFGSTLILIGETLFVHSFLKFRHNAVSKGFTALYIFLALWILIESTVFGGLGVFIKYIYSWYMLSILPLQLYLLYIVIQSIRQKKEYAVAILVGLLCLSLPALSGILYWLPIRIVQLEPPVLEGFFLMTLVFAWVLAARYAKVFTQLEKSHADLLVVDRLKNDFLAMTSHELKTPLHGIMTLTETVADGTYGPVNDKQKENLELIQYSASRLNKLVSEILDLSKIRSGNTELIISTFPLNKQLLTVVSLLRPLAREKGLELNTDLSEDIEEIEADRDRFRQITINLINNAIKYTDEGSIQVSTSRQNAYALITVKDTGRGIPKDRLATIFEPFTQVDDIDTRSEGGVGLGLAIVQQLVNAHNGSVDLESVEGEGTCITVSLPLKSELELREAPPLEHKNDTVAQLLPSDSFSDELSAGDESAVSVLAVDDDPVNLRMLASFFAAKGYNFHSAFDAEKAIAMMDSLDPNLVLLDLMLPGMSGFDACHRLKEKSSRPYLPIVIMTARGDNKNDIVLSFSQGANDYISKPFNRDVLLTRVENQLAIQNMFEIERGLNRSPETLEKVHSLIQGSTELKKQTLSLIEWEKKINKDLDRSGLFQRKMMSSADTVPGITFSVYYRPLLKIGGDMFDIVEVKPGLIRVLIADATGHGISASLNAVRIMTEYTALRTSYRSPLDVVQAINTRYSDMSLDSPIVFTGVVLDIDFNEDCVSVINCGHPEQYILSESGVRIIQPEGPIFGFDSAVQYTLRRYEFSRKDYLLLFTDGIFQYFPFQHEVQQKVSLLESEGIRKVFSLSHNQTPEKIIDSLFKVVRDDSGNTRPQDDVTVLCITRTM